MKTKNLLFFMLLVCSTYLKAQPGDSITLVPFASGLRQPLLVENCGDGRVFVGLHGGQIFVIKKNGEKQHPVYLDIGERVHPEGMLGLAFDPNYLTNGYFYVYYVNKATYNLTLSRFSVTSNRDVADPASEKQLLVIDTNYNANRHNGGCIRFGPDGYLYLGIGDGNKKFYNSPQQPGTLLGKMLRIDVHTGDPYGIPADNPYVDSVNYRPEIWAFGMRNPWRWSFDAVTGDLWIGDVGEHLYEEVDKQPASSTGGENYGFPCYEGKKIYDSSHGCNAAYTPPVYAYPHDTITAFCNAVTGGFVYRGTKNPSLYGKYIFADYCTGIISELYYNKNGSKIVKPIYRGETTSYVSFGEDTDHELYLAAYKSQAVYKIAEVPKKLVGDVPLNSSSLKIAPTVNKGNFTATYEASKSQQVNIRIQNLVGQQMYVSTKFANSGTNTWQMNLHLPKGDYLFVVTDGSHKNVSQRLIVE